MKREVQGNLFITSMFHNLPEDQQHQQLQWVQRDQHLPWVQCHQTLPWHQAGHQHPDVGAQEKEQFIAFFFTLIQICGKTNWFLQEVQQNQQVQRVQPLHAHPVKAKTRTVRNWTLPISSSTLWHVLMRWIKKNKNILTVYYDKDIKELTLEPRGPVGPETPTGPGSPWKQMKEVSATKHKS